MPSPGRVDGAVLGASTSREAHSLDWISGPDVVAFVDRGMESLPISVHLVRCVRLDILRVLRHTLFGPFGGDASVSERRFQRD